MSVGQILSRIWLILRGQWKLFLWIGGLPAAAIVLMEAVIFGVMFATGQFPTHPAAHPGVAATPADMRQLAWLMITGGLFSILYLPIFAMFQAAGSYAAVRADGGERTTLREAYGMAWQKLGRYSLLIFLQQLYFAVPIVAMVVMILGGGALAGISHATSPGMLFLLVPLIVLLYAGLLFFMVWIGLRMGLAFPASVAEDLTATAALKRSGQLTLGAKGRMFLVLLVVYAIGYVVIFALEMVGFVLIFCGAMVLAALHLDHQPLWTGVGGGLMAVFFAVIVFFYMASLLSAMAVSFGVMYGDQRRRMEAAVGAPLLMPQG